MGLFSWKGDEFGDVMTKALLLERVEFLEVMVLNGFSFSSYLSVDRLRYIHKQINIFLKKM